MTAIANNEGVVVVSSGWIYPTDTDTPISRIRGHLTHIRDSRPSGDMPSAYSTREIHQGVVGIEGIVISRIG